MERPVRHCTWKLYHLCPMMVVVEIHVGVVRSRGRTCWDLCPKYAVGQVYVISYISYIYVLFTYLLEGEMIKDITSSTYHVVQRVYSLALRSLRAADTSTSEICTRVYT